MEYRCISKLLIIITLGLFVPTTFPTVASGEQILGIGDSIMYGTGGVTDGPLPTLSTYLGGMTYTNGAKPACCMPNVLSLIAGQLADHAPTRVYNNIGRNDIDVGAGNGCTLGLCCTGAGTPDEDCTVSSVIGVSMVDWLLDYATLLSATNAAGASLYALQIIPYTYALDSKLWNAYLEDWCVTNNIPLAPTYQDMQSTTDDGVLRSSYTGDGLHPNASPGDTVYGYLIYRASVPNRTRNWGSSSYPDIKHDTWSWWTITGTGSVTGGTTDGVTGFNCGGSLSIASGASAVSDVLVIVPGTSISISTTLTQGAVTVSYRTSAYTSPFIHSAASPSWTTYTAPFSTTNNYIQIRLQTSGGTTAIISNALVNWSGTSVGVGNSVTGGGFR